MAENVLYYGDNLEILRRYIENESVDLVYLDPPFKSNQNYNVLFREQNGSRSAAQIEAFKDTWRWDKKAAETYEEIVEAGGKVSRAMQAFHTFLGESDMLAYLAMMAPRLVELKRVLKPTGSIYLHCDPTASAHLRLLMDAVFEPKNFRNEIVWHYRRWTAEARRFQKLHDIVLFYTKRDEYVFNVQYEPYGDWIKKDYKYVDEQGRRWRWHTVKGKRYKVYLEDEERGVKLGDVWQIPYIGSTAKERLGYPTQKPEALLERIIKASSKEGNIVLDPFCGCGTTIAIAHRLKRHWVGIDITHLAIGLIRHRLQDAFGEKVRQTYEVIGEPTDLTGAKLLAKDNPFQFECWALGKVGARSVEKKKGADKGIDGRLYFHDEPESKQAKTKQIIFSVKAGHTGVSHIRDLRGVIEREKAQIGVLISMAKPTKSMRTEAASAGFYKSSWGKHPTLQILTIEELLNGKGVDCPPLGQTDMTFKKAPKAEQEKSKSLHLPFEEKTE